jgi:hypothetical protein
MLAEKFCLVLEALRQKADDAEIAIKPQHVPIAPVAPPIAVTRERRPAEPPVRG